MTVRWRVGRKVGRTIYRQLGEEPSDDDVLIGVMDTPELAAMAVDAVNGGDTIARRAVVAAARRFVGPTSGFDPARRFGDLALAVRELAKEEA